MLGVGNETATHSRSTDRLLSGSDGGVERPSPWLPPASSPQPSPPPPPSRRRFWRLGGMIDRSIRRRRRQLCRLLCFAPALCVQLPVDCASSLKLWPVLGEGASCVCVSVSIYIQGCDREVGKVAGLFLSASVGWVLSELPVKCQEARSLEPTFLPAAAVARSTVHTPPHLNHRAFPSLITYGDRPERPWLTDLALAAPRGRVR
jgi:hypothetical protein